MDQKNSNEFSKPISCNEKTWPIFSLDHFLTPNHYDDCLDRILIPHGLISDRIQKMALEYYNSCDKSKPILALCVLKGASQFFHELVQALRSLAARDTNQKSPQIFIDFIRVKSYENTESSGKVKIIGMHSLEDITDKNVMIVEDLIDTGRTMKKLIKTVEDYKPFKITVASLLLKETPNAIEDRHLPELCGFIVPDVFVIGYCMDYNEYFRDLDHLCIISPEGIQKFKN